ncbi:MAG: flagellar basal-body MS-ring/collar protein FliF [Acidimicrobiales bacterium]
MDEVIEQFRARAGEVTAGFTAVQKVTMGAVFAAVLGGLWFFGTWASTTDMAPLYADLETADAAAIVDQLDSMGVSYELADRGRTVLVPRDQVYELRLDLSTEGLPNGGSEGYSLLDNQGITSTQFQQRIAFQRALEGELAATIRSIDAVNAASVHLVIPQDDLFAADDIHATASVLVETDSTLAAEQVQAIVNLVAGSVEGLRVDAVTVADQTGLVLAAPGQTAFERAGAGGATNQTRAFEQALASQIQTMLTAVVGPGNVMATVSAEMDWDASSTVSEVHTPSVVGEGEGRLATSERLANESYSTNQSDGDGGILGGNEDGIGASNESTFNSSDIERNYAVDSSITTTEDSGGDVQRLNVAVLIDESSSSADQLAEIEALVATAAGIDLDRGDTLAVSRLTFDTTIEDALAVSVEQMASGAAATSSDGMIRTIVLGVLGVLIVAVAGVQLWRGRRATEEIEELDLVTLTNSLTAGAARPVMAAAPAAAGTSGRPAAETHAMTPEEELRALVDQQPDEVARLLRTWLADRRAVAR